VARRPPALRRWRRIAIFAVKLVHSAIFLGVAASVALIFYAGVTGRGSRLTKVAVGAAVGESIVFTINRFQCPLRAVAEELGAESGQVTDIFLPRRFADRIPYIFTPPLVIGLLGLFWRRLPRVNPTINLRQATLPSVGDYGTCASRDWYGRFDGGAGRDRDGTSRSHR
jgi:hypothetical protein